MALLMVSYFFVAMTCVGIIKPWSISLCLGRGVFDWKWPLVYGCLAALAGPIVVLNQRLTRRYAHPVLPVAAVGFFLTTFIPFSIALTPPSESWIAYAFYIWGGIFNLLVPALGWVISYDLYRIREAKRLFGLLATGGILGGAFGSFITGLASADDRVLLRTQIIVSLAVLQGLSALLWRYIRCRGNPARHAVPSSVDRSEETSLRTLRDMLALKYVRCLAGVVLAAAMATTLIDLNYLRFAAHWSEGNQTELTRILAFILCTLFLVSASLQVFGTRRILERFGLPVSLLITPCTLGGASLLATFLPNFYAVLAVKGLGGVLGPSLHRTGLEMLYVPLASRQTTLPLKSFIDLVVFKAGDALGALLFLILSSWLLYPPQVIVGVQVGVITVWGYLAFRLGREYVQHLRISIWEKFVVQNQADPQEGRTEEILLETLQSPDPLKIRLALLGLKQLDTYKGEFTPHFPYEGEILLQTTVSAVVSGRPRWLEMATPMVDHPDPEIGAAALHLLVRSDPVRQLRTIREKLDSEWLPPHVYLCYLDRYVGQPGQFLQPTNVLRWCQTMTPGQQAVLARLMGKSRDQAFLPVLRQWAQQGPGPVALAAIEATGSFAEPRLLPSLTAFLGSYWGRRAARRALACYGESAVAPLVKILNEPKADARIKREIPLVLGDIRCSASRTALVGALYQPDPVVSYRALQALNRISEAQDLSFTTATFLPVLEFWARQYYLFVNLESVQAPASGCGATLLQRALQEREKATLERIFRTLELFLPRGDAQYCYRILVEKRHALRDHAIELIDAQLSPRLKEVVLPFLTASSLPELARAGRKRYGLPDSAEAIFSEALLETDPWFRCCVLAATREWVLGAQDACLRLSEAVQSCKNDINALVRETAQWASEAFPKATKRPSDPSQYAQSD